MIKVKVLKRHVERAKKLRDKIGFVCVDKCPIALAIKEKTHKPVSVQSDRIDYNGKEYHLNEKEKMFIEHFDNEEDRFLKTPFTVTLEL